MMKNKKPYIITLLIALAIFLIIFISKGIFPFGSNSLIWGDMHDQITAFYYHFYDSIYGNKSLLVDFSTSGGINFIGILAYYILSPFSLITLLFPRDQIYLVVSIIIALKIITASITCLYFIRTYFKKTSCWLSVFLALIYAFSGYSLAMYQITSWIDVMYLFPLLIIGLKKVLDLEKPTFYIVVLTLSLICSFYVSIMVVLFIFLSSLVYLLVYKNKEERKKGVLALGITTVISLLLAAFIIVPSYLQISISSRLGFQLSELLNSKTGPITDKIAMFLFGGLMYMGLVLLFSRFKENKKFISWYLPTCLIMLIPVIVEPVNKIWHFGSYAFFTYRAGFIMMFLLIIGACYGFEKYQEKKNNDTIKNKIVITIITLVAVSGIIFLTYRYYNQFQIALDKLTISSNHILLGMLFMTTFLSFITCFLIFNIYKRLDILSITLIGLITVVHITCNGLLYLGIDFDQERLTSQYKDLQELEKTYKDGDIYRVKNITSDYIMNSGMVMKYHNLDHFTSLTDRSNLRSLKKMGYSSMWVKNYSKGGSLFTDLLLANRYIMSNEKAIIPYYDYVGKYGNIYFYKSIYDVSYGYFLNNDVDIMNLNNSFEIQNKIYNSITNDNNLFQIIDDFNLVNIIKKRENGRKIYSIIDDDANNYLEKEIEVGKRQKIYLEILKDLDNTGNSKIYQQFNIYINDKLYKQKALTEQDNGLIDLGTYENEKVNIKIELVNSITYDNITLGLMDLDKYESFALNNKIDTKVSFNRNKINIKVNSTNKQLLFIPIAYNDGYSAKVNGKSAEVIKVFDNYIGVMTDIGDNDIVLSFMPKGLVPMLCVSLITLIGTIILIKPGTYNKLLNIKWLNNIAYYVYLVGYIGLVFLMYVMMTICFILSYFVYLLA